MNQFLTTHANRSIYTRRRGRRGLVGVGGVIAWLREQLSAAEKSLRAREQMEQSWKTGTNAEWDAAAKMHPDTANEPRMKKADRMKESAAQGRIAVRCRQDVEMFKLLLASLGGGGAEMGEIARERHEGETQNDGIQRQEPRQ